MSACDELLERGFMIGCHPAATAGALETLERGIVALGGA
jgi:hypothetical protein